MSEENKFNFSEDEKPSQRVEATPNRTEDIKRESKELFASTKSFMSELLDFRDDTDRDATISAIKADIPFKGATAWILVCSIMVASIGLNADSTAVVIGAMLISPLMGPILGIGLSIAINDIDTLKKSFINLAVMIVLSLITAFLFFKFFPGADIPTNEIFGRTKPDLRDVLIAFFGGAALIIARTKKGTIASVIFGVAIATALMPPLCTAGYGLANDWPSFVGAMYLFTINTIFIALATFLVIKLLRFPMLKYANSKKRRRVSQLASLIAVLVMIWPTFKFVDFIQEKRLEVDFQKFVENDIKPIHTLWLQDYGKINDEVINTETKKIKLYFNGEVSDDTKALLSNRMKQYERLQDYELVIDGNENRSFDKISNAYDRAIRDLDLKDNIISGLQTQIESLKENITTLNTEIEKRNTSNSVSFTNLSKDAKIRFSDLEYFSYAQMLESKDFIKIDTIDVAVVKWKSNISDSLVNIAEVNLRNWLKEEIKVDTVVIRRDN